MYRKFILIGGNRRGNHLLLSALWNHPQVHAYNQLLSHPWEMAAYKGNEFFTKRVFVAFPPEVKAVIFPLSWMSARDYDGFWESMDRHAFDVIHLHRSNLLKVYLSFRIARESERWAIADEWERSRVTIHVDPLRAERYFRDELQYDRASKRHFANRRTLEVCYEEMTRHYERALGEVQDFLGVDARPLRPTIVKQEVRPIRDVVSNFRELEEAWRGTEWETYLKDDSPDPQVARAPRLEGTAEGLKIGCRKI